MANYYVKPGGTGNGTTWTLAWSLSSINFAVIHAGDTVWVAGGNYTTGILVPSGTAGGTSGSPITFSAVLTTDAVPTAATGYLSSYAVTNTRIVFSPTGGATGIDIPYTSSWWVFNGRIRLPNGGYPSCGWQINVPTAGGYGVDCGEGNGGGGQTMANISFYYIAVVGPQPHPVSSDTLNTGEMVGFQLSNNNTSVTNFLINNCVSRGTNELFRSYGWVGVIIEYCYIADSIFSTGDHDDMLYCYAPVTSVWRYNTLCGSFADGFLGEDTILYHNFYFYGNLVYNYSGAWVIICKTGWTYGPVFIYNNTFINAPDGAAIDFQGCTASGQSYVYNNIFYGGMSNNAANSANPKPISDYNAYGGGSTKPSTDGAHSITLTANPFVTIPVYTNTTTTNQPPSQPWGSANDMHLSSAGQLALAHGLTALPNTNSFMATDMDGTARGGSGTYMIGAFDVGGSGPTSTPIEETHASSIVTKLVTATHFLVRPKCPTPIKSGLAITTRLLYPPHAIVGVASKLQTTPRLVADFATFAMGSLSAMSVNPRLATRPFASIRISSGASVIIRIKDRLTSSSATLSGLAVRPRLISRLTAAPSSISSLTVAPRLEHSYPTRVGCTSRLSVTPRIIDMPLFVQNANSGTPSGTSATKAVTLTSQSANNLNIVVISFGNGSGTTTSTISSVVDTNGNVYHPAGSLTKLTLASSCVVSQVYYASRIAAGNNTITVTLAAAAGFFIVDAFEYNDQLASPFIAAASSISPFAGGGYPSAVVSPHISPSTNDLVFAAIVCFDGPTGLTGGSPLTQRDKQYTLLCADEQVVSGGVMNVTATAGGTGGWVAQALIFKTATSTPVVAAGEVLLNDPYTAPDTQGGDPTLLNLGSSWNFWTVTSGSGSYAQINAGAPCQLSRVRISALAGGEDIPITNTISGSNDPNFASGDVTLLTISSRLKIGDLVNEFIITGASNFQYYRYTLVGSFAGITSLDLYANWVPGLICQPADIALSPCTGNFDVPTYITISSLTTSASIYYTTDGSAPTTSSTLYTGPTLFSSNCQLNAFANNAGLPAGRTLSRPVHIVNTEVSTDFVYDDRNYRIWSANGVVYQDPISGWWYRYGVNFDTPSIYTYGFPGVTVYRSADLRNWSYRSTIMNPAAADTTTNSNWHIAPHVLYNAANNNYVAWADSYNMSGGVYTWLGKTSWTATSPEGPFTKVATYTTVLGISPANGDFSLFVDVDGVSAYLVSTLGDTTLGIAKLTTNYTNVSSTFATYSITEEAPWVTLAGGTYYLISSGETGWVSNQNHYQTASQILGPYSGQLVAFQPFAGGNPDYTHSFDTQGWQIVTIPGRTNGYIYHGDRYDNTGNNFSPLLRVRLPVLLSAGTMSISWIPAWSFDAAMPTVSGAPLAATALAVGGTSGNESLSWTNNETKPCSVYVDRATNSSFTAGLASQVVPAGANTFTDSIPFGAGYYRIRSVNASGSSVSATAANGANSINKQGISSAVSRMAVTPRYMNASPPGQPFLVVTPSNAQNNLSWSGVANATSYNIYWSNTSNVTPDNGNLIAGVTSPFSHTNLINGLNYYYILVAVNAFSQTISAQSGAIPLSSGAPVNLKAIVEDNTHNAITWNKVLGADNYNLYWSNQPNVTQINGNLISGIRGTSYLHNLPVPNAIYYYILTAVTQGVEGNHSLQSGCAILNGEIIDFTTTTFTVIE